MRCLELFFVVFVHLSSFYHLVPISLHRVSIVHKLASPSRCHFYFAKTFFISIFNRIMFWLFRETILRLVQWQVKLSLFKFPFLKIKSDIMLIVLLILLFFFLILLNKQRLNLNHDAFEMCIVNFCDMLRSCCNNIIVRLISRIACEWNKLLSTRLRANIFSFFSSLK